MTALGGVSVDDEAPTGHANVVPATPDGDDDWYTAAPTVTLSGYDDGLGVGAPTGGGFRYRIDHGLEHACTEPCTIAGSLLGEGEHTVLWTTIDRFGNRAVEEPLRIAVDSTLPTTTLTHVLPDGANAWHLRDPWLELVAVDGHPTGLRRETSGIALSQYRLPDEGVGWTTVTEPFRLGAGSHHVCVRSVDAAGNDEAERCSDVLVDLAAPTIALASAGVAGLAGWFLDAAVVTITADDASPGAGLGLSSNAAACLAQAGPVVVPGVCVSVDGRPYVPRGPALNIAPGIHTVRTFAIDAAGRRTAVETAVVRVDGGAPSVLARLIPAQAARGGWWRSLPLVSLRAIDGGQSAGVSGIEVRVDGGAWKAYTTRVPLAEGVHTVEFRATDLAGRTTAIGTITVPVDTGAPTAIAKAPTPVIWSRATGPANAKLAWRAGDDRAATVRVRVLVYDAFGQVVRDIDAGSVAVAPGTPVDRTTNWDGKGGLLNQLVPVGMYYYRVVVTDEAGNTAMSSESQPIQIKLALSRVGSRSRFPELEPVLLFGCWPTARPSSPGSGSPSIRSSPRWTACSTTCSPCGGRSTTAG